MKTLTKSSWRAEVMVYVAPTLIMIMTAICLLLAVLALLQVAGLVQGGAQ